MMQNNYKTVFDDQQSDTTPFVFHSLNKTSHQINKFEL